MLSQPLTLNDSDNRGRGLVAVSPPPVLPLVDEGDDDDATQTGVFSPPWSSASSFPPLPRASSLPSAPSLTNPPSFFSSPSSFTPPPVAPSLTCRPPLCPPHPMSLPSFLPPLSPPPSVYPSLFSSVSSINLPPPSVSSAPFMSCSPITPSLVSSAPTPLPPPSSSSSSTPPCTLSASSSVYPFPTSSPPIPPSLHPSPPSFLSPPAYVFVSSTALSPSLHHSPPSSASLPPLLYHPSSSQSPPPPPPASSVSSPPPPSVFFTPHTSSICPPPSSSAHIPLSLISPPPPVSPPPVVPSLLCSVPPPPCCPCSSILPRLLSAHRLEVRRLLRGALASLGRRLNSLERRSKRKRRKKRGSGQRGGGGAACSAFTSSSSSCGPALIPPATSSSSSSASSDSEDTSTPLLPSCCSQSEQRKGRSRGNDDDEEEEVRGRKRKRKRKNRGEDVLIFPENREEDEEEEDSRRFIGRMAVSFRGGEAEEEAPLTLQNFNRRKHGRREEGRPGQSEKAVSVVVRKNGYRLPLLLNSISGSSSQNSLHLLQSAQSVRTPSQSVHSLSCPEDLNVSSGQWRFSDLSPPLSLCSNHNAFHLWLHSFSSSFSPAPMLRLSVVAVETVSGLVSGEACGSPLRLLRDWTAPPSMSSDHCYVQTPAPSRRQQKQRINHSTQSVHPPRRRPLPLPPCSANGLSEPFPAGQSAAGSEFLSTNGERGKRVSQIRIRRASPRETPLTPMGLPKVKRLKKKEFSLEEIYTNKNYKSPTTNRSLETIFEEPREKDGALLLIGQQRRRRLLLFPDFTQPRKRKRPQGAGLPVAMVPRKRAAARRHCHVDGSGDDDADMDVMLVERLSALEDFLTRQGLDV